MWEVSTWVFTGGIFHNKMLEKKDQNLWQQQNEIEEVFAC